MSPVRITAITIRQAALASGRLVRQQVAEVGSVVQTHERTILGTGLDMLPEEYDRDEVQRVLEALVADRVIAKLAEEAATNGA